MLRSGIMAIAAMMADDSVVVIRGAAVTTTAARHPAAIRARRFLASSRLAGRRLLRGRWGALGRRAGGLNAGWNRVRTDGWG